MFAYLRKKSAIILSLLLITVSVLPCLPVTAVSGPMITISDVNSTGQDEVIVDIDVKYFSQVSGIQLFIDYGELEFVSASSDYLTIEESTYSAENGTFIIVNMGEAGVDNINSLIPNDDLTTLLSITFSLPDSAQAGDTFNIELDEENTVLCDDVPNSLLFSHVNGGITYSGDVAEIEITSLPNETQYIEGQEISTEGMIVVAHFADGTSLAVENYTLSYSSEVNDNATVTVLYGGKTATFFVTFIEKPLVSIAIKNAPKKLIYDISDELDVTGGVLTLTYDNGLNEDIDITSDMISGFDSSEAATKTLTVTYKGKTAKYDITVKVKELSSIKVTTKPNKLTYLEGDSFDGTGLVVTAYYDNLSSEVVDNYTLSGYDSSPGTKTITVSYENFTDSFSVTVNAKSVTSIQITASPSKLEYTQGEGLSTGGMVVTAYYNNNTSAAVSGYAVSGYNSNTVGTQTVTVSYQGKTATFTVNVIARVPSNITSSKYTVSGSNVSKITAGTTAATLLSGINEGSYCKVYKGNSVMGGNTVLGTGMTVKLMDGSAVKASYTVVVTGDTNGDGNITVTDMIAIKAHVLKKTLVSGASATAADTNGDNSISITDFIQVKAKILGKGSITAR